MPPSVPYAYDSDDCDFDTSSEDEETNAAREYDAAVASSVRVVAEDASDMPLLGTECTSAVDYCLLPLPAGAIGDRTCALIAVTLGLYALLASALVSTLALLPYAAGTLTERWQVLLALWLGLAALLASTGVLACRLGATATSRYPLWTLVVTASVLVLVGFFTVLVAFPPSASASAQEIAAPLYVALIVSALFYGCAICCRARTSVLHVRSGATHRSDAKPTTRTARRPRRAVAVDTSAFRSEPLAV